MGDKSNAFVHRFGLGMAKRKMRLFALACRHSVAGEGVLAVLDMGAVVVGPPDWTNNILKAIPAFSQHRPVNLSHSGR